ncbi:MAG: acyl-protein synthetase [Kofleriaceae bacterium]
MTSIADVLEPLLDLPMYTMPQAAKEAALVPALAALTAHHRARCGAYDRLGRVQRWPTQFERIAEIPWLPAALWKTHRLVSVADDDIATTLTSSGTTGQVPSRVFLDKDTARRQSRALARIVGHVLGPQRLPMLVIDTASVLRDRTAFSARGAGVLGMMTFGARPVFALDDDLRLDVAAIEAFLARHGQAPFLVFGFTYMVWAYLHRELVGRGLDLSRGVLFHSGGWKKLAELAVDNQTFRRELLASTRLHRIHNFYGTVEQVGSVLLEGDDGLLYAPPFADVIVRDPVTLAELPPGHAGVLQLISALPSSYPGHSVLTEDLGIIEHVDRDSCGRLGKAIRVIGRVPRAELRGCGDTHAASRSLAGALG